MYASEISLFHSKDVMLQTRIRAALDAVAVCVGALQSALTPAIILAAASPEPVIIPEHHAVCPFHFS
jgi:hypothetical protein